MKLLIYALNYAPEVLGAGKYTTEMAEWLAARGHQIRVICAPPYYPQWRVQPPYRQWLYRGEIINGVEVIRCPLWVPRKPGGVGRIVHLVSFAFSSLWALLLQLRWRPDCLVLVLPTVACAPGAHLFRWLRGCRSWVHVQDFELEAATGLGIMHWPWLQALVGRLRRSLIRGFDHASTISDRMRERLGQDGVDLARSSCLPNWVDCQAIHPNEADGDLRRELGLKQEELIALYAGTLNVKHDVEAIIDVARILRDREGLRFVICGEGPEKFRLQQLARGLANVVWLNSQPGAKLPALLAMADVHLLPQRSGAADFVMPSKLGGMMASGRAVIVTANTGTQLASVVDGRGIVVPPGDTDRLADAVCRLAQDPGLRKRFGEAARGYAEREWDKPRVLNRFATELERLVSC